jgi:hypothetical protein
LFLCLIKHRAMKHYRLCGLVVRVPGYRSRSDGFDSRLYQIFWQVAGLERGLLSLVNTTEELLERKSSGSGLEHREYGRRDPSHWPCDTLHQKLALTSLPSGGRSVGIVCSRTQTTEFFLWRITENGGIASHIFNICARLKRKNIFAPSDLSQISVTHAYDSRSPKDMLSLFKLIHVIPLSIRRTPLV